jgi:hypothetical protein
MTKESSNMVKRLREGWPSLRRTICLDTQTGTKHDTVVLFFYGLAVIFICSMLVLPRMGGSVFFSWDSANYIASANEYLDNDFGPYLTAAYTQSLGNIAAVPFNFHLQPEARLAFLAGRIDPVLFYTVSAILFYISTFAVGVTFGMGAGVSTVAGIVFPLLTLPFTSPPWYTEIFWWHFPLVGPGIYLWTTLTITYYLMGRLDGWRNAVTLGIFIGAVLWAMLAYAKIVFVLYASVGLFCLLFTLGSQSWKELAWKVMGTACTIIIVVTMGPFDFLRGLYGHASNGLFTTDYLKAGLDLSALLGGFFYPFQAWRDGLFWLNLVWIKSLVGYPLAVLSILGAAGVLWKRQQSRGSRLLAAGLLLTYPFSFEAIYGSLLALDVFHLMVLFAVIAVSDIAAAAWRAIGRFRAGVPEAVPRCLTMMALATIVVAIVFVMKHMRPTAFPYPPSRTALIAFLESDIQFGIGDRFRGRFVNLELFPNEAPDDRPRRTSAAFMERSAQTGLKENNDYFLPGLRYFDIPATVEYNRWATPVSVVFLRYLLGQDNEVDRIDLRVLSRFDPRLMRMIGVRYVLSRHSLTGKGIALAYAHPVQSLSDARLYELFDTNVGQYSPKEVRTLHDFVETLRLLADERFDPRRTIVLHGEAPASHDRLESAANAMVTRISDGLHVRATSAGKSVLLLPFEFSHCLKQDVVSGSNVRIERANLMLTALHFERSVDVRVRFRFGPFTNSGCRLQDMAEIRSLGLTAAGLEAFVQDNPGRLLFDGLH